ncbi:unnamed protein product [Pedinophyceae sp. YPF-701]|nr:unnamed protein product [Pedinophyceae sp. YPF-701]
MPLAADVLDGASTATLTHRAGKAVRRRSSVAHNGDSRYDACSVDGVAGLRELLFVRAYIFEWALVLVLVAFSLAVPAASSPGSASLVASLSSTAMALGIPAGIFLAGQVVLRNLVDLHHSVLTLCEAYALALTFKRWLGGLCSVAALAAPEAASPAAALLPLARSAAHPSCQATYVAIATTVLALYLLGKLRVLAKPTRGAFLKAVAVLAALTATGYLVRSSHSLLQGAPAPAGGWSGVAAAAPSGETHVGAFLGLVCGSFCYSLNYPSVLSPDSGHPRLAPVPLSVRDLVSGPGGSGASSPGGSPRCSDGISPRCSGHAAALK